MAQTIGYFQFDNLVKGRVPFLFINLDVDTTKVYPHVYKMHLERMQLEAEPGELATADPKTIVEKILAMGRTKSDAVVLLCDDGMKTEKIAKYLEQEGFINVIFVLGGWQQMMKERSS